MIKPSPTLLAASAGIALAFAAGWYINGTRWDARHAGTLAQHATAVAQAQAHARATEARLQDELEGVARNARELLQEVDASAAAAGSELDRLRAALAERARRASQDTGAACRGETATGAIMVYSELLDRAASRATELAAEADRRRIAGLACEAAHDALRGARW